MKNVPYRLRIEHARKARTYEPIRGTLHDLIEIRQMKHREVAALIGLHIQTVRTAAAALGLSSNRNGGLGAGGRWYEPFGVQVEREKSLVLAIKSHMAELDRGW